jgi:hypothetical protein
MTYEDMADWLYYNLDPNDYTSFKDFYKGVAEEFGINDELARNIALPFWEQIEEPKEKPKPKPKEVKLTKTQETDIKNVIQNEDLTKREVSIRTLEIVNKPFSLKQFYDETGMIQSTARRELGQAVKRGEIERVSRGVYRRL